MESRLERLSTLKISCKSDPQRRVILKKTPLKERERENWDDTVGNVRALKLTPAQIVRYIS